MKERLGPEFMQLALHDPRLYAAAVQIRMGFDPVEVLARLAVCQSRQLKVYLDEAIERARIAAPGWFPL